MLEQMSLFPATTRSWVDDCRRPRRRLPRQNRGHHENSLASNEAIAPVADGRRAAIRCWLIDHGPATDRQIRDGIFGNSGDMNLVRPRVTELIDAGSVIEDGRVKCPTTGMTVRLVRAV
jgi:hypothetical protein